MKRSNSNDIGVSSVVGSLLLVAIVFIMGSAFAGLVLTTNFDPQPAATIGVEQITDCQKNTDETCLTEITVQQMSNADYVLVTHRAPLGATTPTQTPDLQGQTPGQVDDIPDNPSETSILDSSNADRGLILVGVGDKSTIESDPGTDITVFAGIDGHETVVFQYTVQEVTVE